MSVSTQVITPRITRLSIPGPRQPTNAYLVGCSDSKSFWLIDTGAFSMDTPHPVVPLIKQVLQERKGRLEGVLVTHGHAGHCGGVEAVKREFGGTQVKVYRSGSNLKKGGNEFGLKDNLVLGSEEGAGKLKIRCLMTPGHSCNGFSFLVEEDRAVLTGDAVFSLALPSGLALDQDSLEPLELASYARLESASAYLSTLASLLSQFPYFLLPGHGEPVLPHNSPPTFLERAMEAQEALAKSVVKGIKQKGMGALVSTRDVVEAVLLSTSPSPSSRIKDPVRREMLAINAKAHLVDLSQRGKIVRHSGGASGGGAGKEVDPSKVFGPGGLNMVQVMGLIKDREAKDREFGKAPKREEGNKMGGGRKCENSDRGQQVGDAEVDASLWEVIS